MVSSPDKSGHGAELLWPGLGAAWSASYLRAWPNPHWALNAVYLLWAIALVALLFGVPAVGAANRGLTVPTTPLKLAQYRRRTALALAGLSVLGVLFFAPWLLQFSRLSPQIQTALILTGWGVSVAILMALHRNRLAWVKLMSEPAD